jgi:hypothetical protein
MYYIIFIIYYSSDSLSSLVTESVTFNIIQSFCLVDKGRLKERCGLEPRTNFFSYKVQGSNFMHILLLIKAQNQ